MHCLIIFFICLSSLAMAQDIDHEALHHALVAQGNEAYENCSVTVLPSAQEKFDDMLSAIAQARRFVHVEYFNLRNDSIGWELLHLLERKAEEGVEVRVLIDAFGYRNERNTLTSAMKDEVRSHGVQLVVFDPMRFPWINHALHRDHRKIVVVDGQLVYTGGINVADYYLRGKRRVGKWRDTHMRMEGPVVAAYQQIFARIWEQTTREHLDSLVYRAQEPLTVFHGLRPDSTPSAGGKSVVVVNREPGKLSRRMSRAYVAMLDAARDEVRIVNPYPMNVKTVRRAMYRALERGVRLRIMVSATCDSPIVPDVVAIEMKKMMNRGAEVYYYEGGFHHSKIMMVDGSVCTIGTANLDARSMKFDYEVNAFIFDPYTTKELNDIFSADLSVSHLLTKENFKRRFPLKNRISGRVFAAVKGIL